MIDNNSLGLRKIDEKWIPLQIKVFTRWVQCQLKDFKEFPINDVTRDLSDGIALIYLAKSLTGKDTPRQWIINPVRNVDKVQNCELAIEMFVEDGVHLLGISGKDINENNQKLILGLIWMLIVHYSIGQSVDLQSDDKNNNIQAVYNDRKKALLSWAIDRTSKYPNIKNFAPYDLSLCALLDSFVPEKVNYYSLNPTDSEHNSKLATRVMEELGIPVLVYPNEINKSDNSNEVDEKSLLTQLSSAKFVLDKQNASSSSSDDISEDDSKLEDELQTVMQKKESAEAEVERLSKALATIEEESKAKGEENIKAENEIEHLKQSLTEKEVNIQNLVSVEKQKSKIEIDQLKSEIENLQKELSESKLQINELMKTLSETQKDNKPEMCRITKEVSNSEIIQKELSARIESLSEQIKQLMKELSISKDHETELSRKLSEAQKNAKTEIDQLTSENEKLKLQLSEALFESQRTIKINTEALSEVERLKIELAKTRAELESETKRKSVNMISHPLDGDNNQIEGKTFGLTMTIRKSDYNDGKRIVESNVNTTDDDQFVTFGIALVNDEQSFINPAGLKLDITHPNIENDVNQQFIFGKGLFNTVIDSAAKKGMVWDVADQDNLNPPEGTPFYLFPFHGRHNQRFIYKDEMIYAKQNGQVVTYVGGDVPFVMMEPKEALKSRQTFHVKLM
ncbi:GTPase activator activity protein [Tritrichomonas musculus]|uniref:GTPase activator activity protein n=1 Tax=Tritrichomonas musculus TaxID=1915356 RepID=A0ABR2IDD0_9EUKA